MPDVREGLSTQNDALSEEAVEAQLQARQQTAQSRNIDAAVQFAPADLLSPEINPTIESGLTSANDPDQVAARELARLRAERAAYEATPEGRAQVAAEDAALQARAERESDLRLVQASWMVEQFDNATDDADRAAIYFDSDDLTRAEILEQVYGVSQNEPVDPDVLAFAREDLAHLAEVHQREQAERAEADRQALSVQATVAAAASRYHAQRELLAAGGFAENDPRGQAWLTSLEQVAAEAGVNIAALDGQAYSEAIRGADATMREVVRTTEEARFKEQFFAPDSKISSGLTVLGSDGRYHRTDERPNIQPRINGARIGNAIAGGAPRGESADDIRRGILGLDDPAKADYQRVMREGQRIAGEAAAHAAELARATRGY